MTTQAPLILQSTPSFARARQETAPLEAGATAPILNSLALLEHRIRRRAIRRRLAPFGHYLAFADNGTEWLVPSPTRSPTSAGA